MGKGLLVIFLIILSGCLAPLSQDYSNLEIKIETLEEKNRLLLEENANLKTTIEENSSLLINKTLHSCIELL